MSHLLKRYANLSYSNGRTLAGLMALGLLVHGLGLVIPRATQYTLDEIVPSQNLTHLFLAVGTLVLVVVLQQALAIWRRLQLVRWSLHFDRITWKEFVEHLFSISSLWHRGQKARDLVARLTDHEAVRHFILGVFPRITVDAGMVLVYAIVLLAYDVILGGLVLVGLSLVALHAWWGGVSLRRAHTQLFKTKAQNEAYLQTALHGIELIQATELRQSVTTAWGQQLERTIEANQLTQKKRQLLESTGSFLQSTMSLMVLGYGAALVIRGQLTLGSLIAVQLYAAQALQPVQSLMIAWDEWQRAIAATERIDQIYDIPSDTPRAGFSPSASLRGEVAVDNLTFQYPNTNQKAIDQLSLALPEGKCLAVVGASSIGKTTLLRLLLGLMPAQKGKILIDGHDLQMLDLAWYRRQIGVVFQEAVFLGGTIPEIVAWGDSNPDMAHVVEALQAAGLDSLLLQTSLGTDPCIADFGGNLSAGQRQRLALARCLYRQPRLLLLDEPTANLDKKTEQDVIDRLAKMIPGRTTILVTHRQELLSLADFVLDLERNTMVSNCRSTN